MTHMNAQNCYNWMLIKMQKSVHAMYARFARDKIINSLHENKETDSKVGKTDLTWMLQTLYN